jgi:glycosyltransferase involved in cell wall biosynthesis
MSLKILYVTAFDFFDGGAATRRVLGNINTLEASGADVISIIDAKYLKKKKIFNFTPVVSVQERPEPDANVFKKIYKYLLSGSNTIKYIKSQTVKPDVIILYSGYSPYLIRLIRYCKRNNIKLVFDCVEWYQPKSYLQYFYSPYYWNIEFAMRFLVPRCNGVICISSFLEEYYSKKGSNTICIPPTISESDIPTKKITKLSSKIKLAYTGSPGHKDKLNSMIEVISLLDEYFELHIAGVEGISNNAIHYHGTLTHQECLKLVSEAHFSVLLRPDNKVSKAGFSTKVVESMFCGTPVIANNTGDLSKYIINDLNGYIFEGTECENLYSKLKKIAESFDESKYRSLSMETYLRAKEHFDFNVYQKPLINMIRNCR